MDVNGENARSVITAGEGESLNSVLWSPDSQRIAFERLRFGRSSAECSIESRDMTGGHPVVVLSDPKLATGFGGGFWWLPDGRVIYSFGEAPPPNLDVTAPGLGASETNLWEIKVDTASGKPAGKPRRISDWADFSLANLSASVDGKRAIFSRVNAQADVYVGDVEAGGKHLKALPRRFTLDERNDWPTAWSPDSRAIFFVSDRSGKYEIYRQALDEQSAQTFVTNSRVNGAARLSADGRWLIYCSWDKTEHVGTSAPSQICRTPVTGGPSQVIATTAHVWGNLACAQAPDTMCIIGEQTNDERQLVLTAIDPVKGKGPEITRIPLSVWGLSPDGSTIAFKLEQNRIRLLPIGGGRARDLTVEGSYNFTEGPDWSADGKGLYFGSSSPRGATLIYVDLKGHVTPVWEQKSSLQTWAIPSPDGKHLAITSYPVDTNVWMIENF
jgi:Tol biopolymer transport system component